VIVVLRAGCPPEQVAEVVSALAERGVNVRELRAGGRPVLHVVSGSSRRARVALRHECVEGLVATSGPRIRREGQRFFPYHFVQWTALGFVLLAGLTLLAGQFPPGLGDPVDPQHEPVAAASPWYLRAPLAFVGLFPEPMRWLGWAITCALLALLVLVPQLDRGRAERSRGRGISLTVTAILVVALLLPIACGVIS
jgi:quinol-cytochrome oxidoreductase complex cytochrome b subunit